ncbi:MAG TPA: ABC transporter ATP-binding protein, partial [Actinomycetales bacterium]
MGTATRERDETTDRAQDAGPVAVSAARRLDWRRLKGPVALLALVATAVSALGQALGTVVAGQLADSASAMLVAVLAGCVVGAALLDTVGRTLWAAVVDRAEGRLRSDLLDAVMHQPLEELSEQAVGEVLDRVDDDTHEVGSLLRQDAWGLIRLLLGAGPLLVVAGLTWWPAWLLLPVAAGLTYLVIRPSLAELVERKVVEEIAWTNHAAAMEEGVAARDDLRTSLGQGYLLRRIAELSRDVHARFSEVLALEAGITRRAGVLLHAVLAAVAVAGVALVMGGVESIATLVTLFLVTTTFVGQIDQVTRHIPDLQAGLGAVVRLRGLLQTAPEPVGGRPLPPGLLGVELRNLHFAYLEGTFALRDIDLEVPAGTTCAFVGRSGSGKSTLASLLSRAVEPERGTVLLGGVDVLDLDLQQLRAAVGVVTQRTEILAGTLAENITLFADLPRDRVEAAVVELDLVEWVAGLPQGLDTLLGPSGTTLSAGEEQLVSFARLLVRDVRVVVLDEATARMDPVTEARVVAASQRLLSGRTGVLIAHRLTTTARADHVAVLQAGRVVQHGARTVLAHVPGPFRTLLEASDEVPVGAAEVAATGGSGVGTARRGGTPPPVPQVEAGPGLARGIWHSLRIHPAWGLASVGLFTLSALTGAYGAVTGLIWGLLVEDLKRDGRPLFLMGALVAALLIAPLLLAEAIARYPRWWVAVMLRARVAVLLGQTRQHRLDPTPPGEVVARAMDADRFARYGDRWVDLGTGLVIVVVTAALARSLLAGGVLLAVMVASAAVSALGSPVAGRSAAEASAARARFGRSLVSALDSVRTVKLAAATPEVHGHLRQVDHGRVDAAVREHRVQALLAGVPVVLVQVGAVAAWGIYVAGGWGIGTALLVSGAVNGFDWFGRVAGAVITEAPGTRAWQHATSRFAGGHDLMDLPAGLDLVTGASPPSPAGAVDRLDQVELV